MKSKNSQRSNAKDTAASASEAGKSKAGRKEVLTADLAKQIVSMIQRMPDAGVPVTWRNIEIHCSKRFGHTLKRGTLSQKAWGGRKLISEAYDEATLVEAALKNDAGPKYKTAPRAVLQKKIAEQEARIMALQEELEAVRAQQMHALDAFLNTRLDLRNLMAKAAEEQP